MSMLRLTGYETGRPVLVDISRASSITEIAPSVTGDVCGTGATPIEHGPRTRIIIPDEKGFLHLVRESIEEIEAMRTTLDGETP